MIQMVKKKLKNEKGFTLIELLAVIVILGILAAIAIPSVLGIIDNTKKDAHVANAQQMISAAKMAIASDSTNQNTGGVAVYLTLEDLESKQYLDPVDSPDKKGGTDTTGDYIKTITGGVNADTDKVSYVKIIDGKVMGVKLVTSNRGITLISTDTNPISSKSVTRDLVK